MKNKYLAKIKNMPKEAKASFAYTICNILQKSLTILTLPLFTRLLTKEQVGQTTIYATWMAMITIFSTLELPYGTFNTAMVKFQDDRDGYISSVQMICTTLTLIFLIIYLPLHSVINSFFKLPTLFVIIMLFEILFQTSFMFWCGKKRFEYKYISVIIITLLISVLSPVLAFVFIFLTEKKGYAKILGYSIVTIIVGLIIYIINCIKGKKFFNKKYWKYALSFNVPLLAYYLSQTIFNQSDKLMIDFFCGRDKAGVYGIAYSLAMILTFVLNAINNAYTPWLYNKINEKQPKENKKISAYIAILMAVLLTGIIWFAPEIIYIMAGENYMEAIWIVPPVSASLLLLLYTQYFNDIEFFFQKKIYLIISSIIPALINIGLNYVLIPKFGFIAAGYTTFISYVFFALINYMFIFKYIKKGSDLNGLFDEKILLLILFVFIAFNIIGMLLYKIMLARFIIMILLAIVLFLFRKRIILIIKNLKKREDENVEETKELLEDTQE